MINSWDDLWAVIVSAFGEPVWGIVTPAIFDTLYMVVVTLVFTFLLGLVLGVVLVVTDKTGISPLPTFNRVLGTVVNVLRSFPSMILIILFLPLSRILLGKTYGADACILALVASVVPMTGRLVEGSIREITKGKIEAAKAMGTGNWSLITKVLLPEALPSLVRSLTVATIAIIGTTALSGSFGAGGLGDVAIRYGYNRFKTDILIATVLVLIALVQTVQMTGDAVAKRISHRRGLT